MGATHVGEDRARLAALVVCAAVHRAVYTVGWPVQGEIVLRSRTRALVLADVYAHWVLSELCLAAERRGSALDLAHVWTLGFRDPQRLIERADVDSEALACLADIDCGSAPEWSRVVPDFGAAVPTPGVIVCELMVLLESAIEDGTLEMEVL